MKTRIGVAGILAAACAGVILSPSAALADTPANSIGPGMIQNVQTALCLDGDHSGNIYTKGCSVDNPYQHWRRFGDGRMQSVATGLCLTAVDAGSVRGTSCGRPEGQQWTNTYQWGSSMLLNNYYLNVLDSDTKGNAYMKDPSKGNPYQGWKLL
ncbi:ricin-type beta-trefoil lectin domain protein [Kitasatospora sp. NPDC059327]|uniref:ricin-type beta-trefoil lectin domain protein n=1 Tax=Kitasatospora sp. NPDC059327 TaxID=3346803 RepID=UPI00369584FE